MKSVFPIFDQLVSREEKERLLEQSGKVLWLFGQSGSGKTTIALELEKKLTNTGKYAIVLDGDNLRTGINEGLGFTIEDRMENIRRAAEIAKILVNNGVIVIACFVCPLQTMRDTAREIIGKDFHEIYIKTSLETLMKRDTKGFYKKALVGKMENLTGVNSSFEASENAELIIDTEEISVDNAVHRIFALLDI